MANREILLEINEARKLCMEAGYEPVALLINPKVSDILREELKDYSLGIITLDKILGLTVFEHPKVKDFYLVDNRTWAEQKW
jgi:hypothetical protein